MLSSIHPLGERAKGNRWSMTATAFVVGSLAGGLTAGGAAALVGIGVSSLLDVDLDPSAGVVAVVLLAALLLDLRPFGLRTPSIRRQVDEAWLDRYRGWVYGLGFGFQLGLGIVTVVATAAVYAALFLAVLSCSLTTGLLIGGTFGLVRGLAILPGFRVTTPAGLRAFHRALNLRSGLASKVTVAGELVLVLAVTGTMMMG
jgi:hypothetical protein